MKRILLLFSLVFSLSFYGQHDTLSVVRHTDKDIVIPKNLKVVYRGIENELFIDVPNAKSFVVSGNGIIMKDKNTFDFNPAAGKETILTIAIVLKSGKKVIEQHVFSIRNFPAPISTFNKNGERELKLQKNAFKNGVVELKFPDKNLEDIFEVTSFGVKIPGMEGIVVNGNKIDSKTFDKINRYTSKGDLITIYDIKTKWVKIKSNGPICGISPIVLQIL